MGLLSPSNVDHDSGQTVKARGRVLHTPPQQSVGSESEGLMKIITGRGKARKVHLDIPCSEIVNRSKDTEIKAVGEIVCNILGIKA